MTSKLTPAAIIPTLLLTMIFILSGCSITDGEDATLQRTISVKVQEVQLSNIEQQISFSGTIEEALSVPLSFSVPGTVSEVFVHEGDAVRKGQVLANLDSESWQNSYEMARAKAEQAEDAYQRMLPMHQNGSLPEIKFVEVETGLQEARSSLALAQKNLDDCMLIAPVDGIVGQRSIDPGMGVASSINTITLVRIDTVYARISVSENEIAPIHKGMTALVVVESLKDELLHGKITQMGVMADPLMHTYKVKVMIPNPDHLLLPGMLCSVMISESDHEPAVTVPTGCVMSNANGHYYLFVADTIQNVARRREVTPGPFVNTGMEIVEGLSSGEWVIVFGQQKLSDQTPINYVR